MSHDVAALDQELNAMIASGRVMKAFEKFYADDCIMQENDDTPREGKAACRQYEIDFFENVEQFHEGTLLGSAVEEDRSFSEWVFDLTLKDGSRMRNHQISARHWADGKVVFEQFFYKPNITPSD